MTLPLHPTGHRCIGQGGRGIRAAFSCRREIYNLQLIGILGCNLAWGLIDCVLYVLGCAFERGRLHRIGYEVRAAPSPLRAWQLVAAELDELLVRLIDAHLVFACSFPAVLPFLLFHEPRFGLRVSNTIPLALLYYLGCRHALHTHIEQALVTPAPDTR